LASCVGSTDCLWRFFEALYFDTVPEALAKLRLDEKTRPLACIRSLAHATPDAVLKRRPLGQCSDRRRPIPVRSMPMDRYLKARGFETPRTWISGLAEQLRAVGADHLVAAAKVFYREAVNRMLVDPKGGDQQGDNFVAWLRACHRDVFRDIDRSDPSKLQKKDWVQSMRNPKSGDHEYFLKSISIPGFEEAFSEIATEQTQVSTIRQQMLSKIIVDAFALRSVDLAIILKIANLVSSAPADEPVVVVLYAGGDHTDSVTKFWRTWGFTYTGLPKKGRIAKASDADSNCLRFPSYLHDFRKLFPVPTGIKDVALRMAQSEEREARRNK